MSEKEVCNQHSGFHVCLETLGREISEIKADVKAIAKRLATEDGEKKASKNPWVVFAAAAGIATPICALVWAVWKP